MEDPPERGRHHHHGQPHNHDHQQEGMMLEVEERQISTSFADDDYYSEHNRRSLDSYLQTAYDTTRMTTTTSTTSTTRRRRTSSTAADATSSNISNVYHSHPPPFTDDDLPTPSALASATECFRSSWRQWKYWGIILSLGVANSSDASEILCISYILSDEQFQKDILRSQGSGGEESGGINRGGLLAAAVFFGMLIGGLIVGTMGDWIGRRPMLLLGLGCNAVAGVISAFAPDVLTLSFLRCIAGVGIGATVPPLFTLATELAPPSIRGLCVTICASFWMVGSVYVALIAMWFFQSLGLSWRIFAIACAVPCAAGFVLVYWYVPESPRFLGLEQRSKEATDVANLLARKMDYVGSGPPLTITELEMTFPTSAVQDMEQRQHDNSIVPGGNGGGRSGAGYFNYYGRLVVMAFRDFLHSTSQLYKPSMIRTTLPLQMAWFALSFGSYGLVTWINTIFVEVKLEDVYLNALLFAFSNAPGNLIAATLMDKIGRSKMLVGSIIASSISLVAFARSAFELNSFGVITSACLFQCFTISAWNTIDTMTSELFPTLIRSTGLGVCAASGRVGAMVAQFVNGALAQEPVRLLLVAAATMIFGALTPCLLPGDMTGRPVHDDLSGSGPALLTNKNHSSSPTISGSAYQNVTSSSYKDAPDDNDDRGGDPTGTVLAGTAAALT
mmetsp:Transcript_10769/g.25668  ORF Transcript_10769/g.25668 Transcript_10769/m.25668 type:complete len:673 (-) Transcript_10769:72-2090(-)